MPRRAIDTPLMVSTVTPGQQARLQISAIVLLDCSLLVLQKCEDDYAVGFGETVGPVIAKILE